MTKKIDLRNTNLPSLHAIKKEMKKRKMLKSHAGFVDGIFEEHNSIKLLDAPFHPVLFGTLDKVLSGEIKRLVINIPPGAGKTEFCVLYLVARGFAINPKAKFIHTSFSDALVLDNSSKIKDIIQLDSYKEHWDIDFKTDSSAKGLWKTEEGGAFRAASSKSGITGFRAGYMDKDVFTGAILIDDPLKPGDALSDVKRNEVNANYMNTMNSRKAHEDVPVILIQQRLHTDDNSAFLLNGGSGEKWHHLTLPAWIDHSETFPEYSHAITIPNDLPEGSLWDWKYPKEFIENLKNDEYVATAQYMQRPTPMGGALFKSAMFQEYKKEDIPNMLFRFAVGDTALTEKTTSDYTVFGHFGMSIDGRLYLLGLKRFKADVPEMEVAAFKFWDLAKSYGNTDAVRLANLRTFYIEKKASGIGLEQRMAKKGIPVTGIERIRDKLSRAVDVTPTMNVNPLMIPSPEDFPEHKDFMIEMLSFTGSGSGNDDMVDVVIDAVNETLVTGLSMMDVL